MKNRDIYLWILAPLFLLFGLYWLTPNPGQNTTLNVNTSKEGNQMIGSDSIIATPDILVYSQESTGIVEGRIKEINPWNNNSSNSYQDVTVTIEKNLKGNFKEGTVSILVNPEEVNFKVNERVLLFLGMDSEGRYVVAGSYAGKCLIDDKNNVTGATAFSMPLSDLERKITEALQSN